eukprot:TRINITY_DN9048_c0_g1_i1.p1 TRINITY_DN9048_c0_g1~~TRINITY_DN9048_c0_g1_i1.p1  ORF type:complete len:471 (+),score=128.44 TRINITY_DN9048_c0_g1_i1:54-1415(+)
MKIQDATAKCEEVLNWMKEGSWSPEEADDLSKVLLQMQEEVAKKSWRNGVEQERISQILATPIEKGEVTMIQTHKHSAMVAVVEAGSDRAVVKCRGQYPDKSRREVVHYKLAEYLGLDGVVAPIITTAVDLKISSRPSTNNLKDVLQRELFDFYSGAAPPVEHCSAEAFIACNPWESTGIASALSNEKGFCDLQSAFLSTPLGKLADEGNTLLLSSTPTDYDFIQLIETTSQEYLEKLILLNIVTLQRDGTPVNLMVQELNGGGFKLMAIDNTRTFGDLAEDKLILSLEEDDSRFGSYWYPCSLAMPGALKPLSNTFLKEVAAWSPEDIEAFLTRHLTVNNMPDTASAAKCARRVEHIQTLLKDDPCLSLKQLAYKVVPSWEADWNVVCEAGELGPLPDLQELTETGEPISGWIQEERDYYKQERMKMIGSITGATAALLAGGWVLSRFLRKQ